MEALCKWHVIVKYLLKHKSEELFFPIMICAFGLNIVLLSLVYIALVDAIGIGLNTDVSEVAIVSFFFFTIAVLYTAVKNRVRYQKAENWFVG